MGRPKKEMPTRVHMVKARITYTISGYPASYEDVRGCYAQAQPAFEDGWWWIGCSEGSWERIRVRGHYVKGTLTQTYIPAEDGSEPVDYPEGAAQLGGAREVHAS